MTLIILKIKDLLTQLELLITKELLTKALNKITTRGNYKLEIIKFTLKMPRVWLGFGLHESFGLFTK